MKDLNQLLEQVNSKETFLQFVKALEQDNRGANKENDWENTTISDFLESMYAFGEDSSEIEMNWRGFALLLYSGKFYE